MKRTIRFRAWDTKHKWMDEPDGHDLYLTNDGLVEVREEGCWDRYLVREWDKDDRYVLMQFTGLTDKNGKDINEGDVVTVYDPYIETQDGVPIAELPENRIEQIKWERGAWFCGEEMLWEEASGCEVVGNIYENPELLG